MTPGAEKMDYLKNQGLFKESLFPVSWFSSILNITGYNIVISVNRITVV